MITLNTIRFNNRINMLGIKNKNNPTSIKYEVRGSSPQNEKKEICLSVEEPLSKNRGNITLPVLSNKNCEKTYVIKTPKYTETEQKKVIANLSLQGSDSILNKLSKRKRYNGGSVLVEYKNNQDGEQTIHVACSKPNNIEEFEHYFYSKENFIDLMKKVKDFEEKFNL